MLIIFELQPVFMVKATNPFQRLDEAGETAFLHISAGL